MNVIVPLGENPVSTAVKVTNWPGSAGLSDEDKVVAEVAKVTV